jgi:hypothetical protein
MDQTFDRLDGFSLDQDFSNDNMKNDFGDTFTTKNKGDLSSFLLGG